MSDSIQELTPSPAVDEPITLAEAKTHLRIDNTDSDDELTVLIKAARMTAEKVLNRALLNRTLVTRFDAFADRMELPLPPLQSVTSVTYLDADGAEQTLATSVYKVVTYDTVGRIELAYDQTWPTTRAETGAVTVTHVSGYGTTIADVPDHFRMAMLHMVARWYENPEPVISGTIVAEIDNMEMALLGLDRLIPV